MHDPSFKAGLGVQGQGIKERGEWGKQSNNCHDKQEHTLCNSFAQNCY